MNITVLRRDIRMPARLLGIGLANQIPAVDRTIVIAQSDALPSVQLAYSLVLSAGALTAMGLAIGYLAFTNAVSPAFLPSSVAGLLYE